MKKLFVVAVLIVSATALAAPDEDALCKSAGYPRMNRDQWTEECYKVGSMSDMENVYKSAPVKATGTVRPLTKMANPPEIKYFQKGQQKTLQDLLDENRITGLLMLKGDQIAVERYQYDRKPEHKLNSYSMAKSVTAMLIGAALKDGKIKSLDDTVETYVPQLKGSDYGAVTIRNVLRMSSGIKWSEESGKDDVSTTLANNTYRS